MWLTKRRLPRVVLLVLLGQALSACGTGTDAESPTSITCATSTSAGATGSGQFRNVQQLGIPPLPPSLNISGRTFQPFYTESWSGHLTSPPKEMTWALVTVERGDRAILDTKAVPVRVIILSFPSIDQRGIPFMHPTSETVCADIVTAGRRSDQERGCTFGTTENGQVFVSDQVRLSGFRCTRYVVVQVAWIQPASPSTPQVQEADASYGWQEYRQTCGS